MSVKIPEKMLAWQLFGAGMENFGKNDEPSVIDVPQVADDELLVKIDAIGLCFSDVKLIRAGLDHPRVISKDLATDPVIPGHEAVMTIVKVGCGCDKKFEIGQRYIIQADIYVNGVNIAYGYAINGGMAQYSVIDQRILNGDEGCYLLPIKDETPSAVAALMEPWTCVQASYLIENRTAPKDAGSVLIAGGDKNMVYETGDLLQSAKPRKVTVCGLGDEAVRKLREELTDSQVVCVDQIGENEKFDDIFICHLYDRKLGQTIAKKANKGAVISFVGDYPDENWSFDIGNIHYQSWFYQGTQCTNLSTAYGRNVRSTWKPGGTCWLPGGAGAMGQMHTQMAVEAENGPVRILLTDMDNDRIANVKKMLAPKIAEKGIEFCCLNPADFASPQAFEQAVAEFAPDGFDDIIMLVPVIPVLNSAAKFLKTDGLMNIFAGIPAGKEGELNVKAIAENAVRYIGSSGSRTWHLRHTIDLAESGQLQPVTALAAVGGIKELKKGLQAVIDAAFPGKTVIFPNCEDMPLTPVSKLDTLAGGITDTLDENGYYTLATEDKILSVYERKD